MSDFPLKPTINVGDTVFCIININLSLNGDHKTRISFAYRRRKWVGVKKLSENAAVKRQTNECGEYENAQCGCK